MSAIAFPKPDPAILARRDQIIADLARLLPADALVTSDDERRPYETDGLTAYRKLPLAVCLPSTTEQVAAVMKYCHEAGVPVVARGAGTSLCGGAIPQEDAVIIGVGKMSRILSVDYPNRVARVQAGVTNLSITGAVQADGFFYAP
ncbi:MAG: FAD-binding oxidoreductase, partial [Beijerinckiaceae bacterium]